MAVLTGTSGELRFRGVRVGKCREFSLDISRDALETTVLGQWDRTFVEGIRGASGSTTVLYDRDDTATRDLLNSVFRNNDGPQPITLALSTAIGAELDVKAIVTSVSTPVSVGSVIACSVNFQVSGPIGEGF
jgi:hypothetical protein